MAVLDQVHTVASILGLIAIPVVLLIISTQVTKRQKESEVSAQYVKLAIDILRQPPWAKLQVNDRIESLLNEWAEAVVNKLSPVPFSEELSQSLRAGESKFPDSEDFFDQNLDAGKVILRRNQQKPPVLRRESNKFGGDDRKLQDLRNKYLNTVAHIIADITPTPNWAHVVAIWLAGIELHNHSLGHKNWISENLQDHISEMEKIHRELVERVLGIDDIDSKMQAQLLTYLDIHRDNYEKRRKNEVSLRN